jgi:hypothetical protein
MEVGSQRYLPQENFGSDVKWEQSDEGNCYRRKLMSCGLWALKAATWTSLSQARRVLRLSVSVIVLWTKAVNIP